MSRISLSTIIFIALGIVLVLFLFMWGMPRYNVSQQEMVGKAEMAKAEQNRRILVEEAKARLEDEKLNAEAEVARARGMSEAMKVENGQLSTIYNQYLLSERSKSWLKKETFHRLFTCQAKAWCR